MQKGLKLVDCCFCHQLSHKVTIVTRLRHHAETHGWRGFAAYWVTMVTGDDAFFIPFVYTRIVYMYYYPIQLYKYIHT